ncbi:hypothetical protein E3G54_004987 [Mycobacteroides abscessus]|nr:hypothetical protein [Mycobacteroides abscessus]
MAYLTIGEPVAHFRQGRTSEHPARQPTQVITGPAVKPPDWGSFRAARRHGPARALPATGHRPTWARTFLAHITSPVRPSRCAPSSPDGGVRRGTAWRLCAPCGPAGPRALRHTPPTTQPPTRAGATWPNENLPMCQSHQVGRSHRQRDDQGRRGSADTMAASQTGRTASTADARRAGGGRQSDRRHPGRVGVLRPKGAAHPHGASFQQPLLYHSGITCYPHHLPMDRDNGAVVGVWPEP